MACSAADLRAPLAETEHQRAVDGVLTVEDTLENARQWGVVDRWNDVRQS